MAICQIFYARDRFTHSIFAIAWKTPDFLIEGTPICFITFRLSLFEPQEQY